MGRNRIGPEAYLRAIGRSFIGGYRTKKYAVKRSLYWPHQSERERDRRMRQISLGQISADQLLGGTR